MNETYPYPARVRRNLMIGDLKQGNNIPENPILCGRVIGLIDGEGRIDDMNFSSDKAFILQDQSGKMEIVTKNLPKVGTILEVEIKQGANEQWEEVGESKVLADCEDFYISLQESPNYQKMIIDPKLADKLKYKSAVNAAIREFFLAKGFLETETPCLVKLPGMEPYLDVFKTKFRADFTADQKIDEEMYLITSPEYAMKKLLVGGLEKIFQITRSFRNKETFSESHNPEFTILEWYRAYASYLEIMQDTEELVKFLWNRFAPTDHRGKPDVLDWKGQTVDLLADWKRLRVIDAFQEYANIDEETFGDLEKFRLRLRERGYQIGIDAGFDDCFFTVFLNEIEPKLGFGVPVILYDYPVSMAALSKRCDDPRFAERFEVYVAGLELCNAFTELNDPVEQEKRLRLEYEVRQKLGKELYQVDESFIEALKFGMPPSGGIALGVDRLTMLMAGESDIRNILYFPYRDL